METANADEKVGVDIRRLPAYIQRESVLVRTLLSHSMVDNPSDQSGCDSEPELDYGRPCIVNVAPHLVPPSTPVIHSAEELRTMLRVLDFWDVRTLPLFVMDYVYDHGCDLDMNTDDAECTGKLFARQICIIEQCVQTNQCTAASRHDDHLGILKYLHKKGCPVDNTSCIIAAMEGQLEVLKWLNENQCPWSPMACTFAATNGHLEALQYLHEHGCPWNELTCTGACEGGHLSVVQYLYENKCPCSSWAWLCGVAAAHKHPEVVQYLIHQGISPYYIR